MAVIVKQRQRESGEKNKNCKPSLNQEKQLYNLIFIPKLKCPNSNFKFQNNLSRGRNSNWERIYFACSMGNKLH